MGDLYASAIGTTVLQLKEMPRRPTEYDGKLAVYNTRHTLRWQRIGDSPPSGTAEFTVLDNAALAEALSRTAAFTEAEWATFAVDELHDKFEGSQVMHRALPRAEAAAEGVRDAIGQLQQAATKRRRR